MRLLRKALVFAGLGLVAALGGCGDRDIDLAQALAPAHGQVADADGREASIDDVLAAAKGRPVTVSFAYVGCSGRTPRLERLRNATQAAAVDGDVLHIVLNAVDEPGRYPALVRDLIGADANRVDPDTLRVLFVDKGELWPQQPSAAIDGIMKTIGLRYGRDRFVETVSGIGLFDRNGRFVGIRY